MTLQCNVWGGHFVSGASLHRVLPHSLIVILSYALWSYCLMSYCLTSYGHTVICPMVLCPMVLLSYICSNVKTDIHKNIRIPVEGRAMWYQYVEDHPNCYSFCLLLYHSICYLFGSLNRFTISSTYIGDPDADTQDHHLVRRHIYLHW